MQQVNLVKIYAIITWLFIRNIVTGRLGWQVPLGILVAAFNNLTVPGVPVWGGALLFIFQFVAIILAITFLEVNAHIIGPDAVKRELKGIFVSVISLSLVLYGLPALIAIVGFNLHAPLFPMVGDLVLTLLLALVLNFGIVRHALINGGIQPN